MKPSPSAQQGGLQEQRLPPMVHCFPILPQPLTSMNITGKVTAPWSFPPTCPASCLWAFVRADLWLEQPSLVTCPGTDAEPLPQRGFCGQVLEQVLPPGPLLSLLQPPGSPGFYLKCCAASRSGSTTDCESHTAICVQFQGTKQC